MVGEMGVSQLMIEYATNVLNYRALVYFVQKNADHQDGEQAVLYNLYMSQTSRVLLPLSDWVAARSYGLPPSAIGPEQCLPLSGTAP
jgi:hypothetical protein